MPDSSATRYIELSTGTPETDVEESSKSVKAGVELVEDGKVQVVSSQRTSNPKVFAIGDLVNAKALARKASEEEVVAAESAAGVETQPLPQGLVAGATFQHSRVEPR
jgi:pyruvate/2-oxoglutarate dehydrogenase complex dihydrolipoamide dehydrogenase (E3) component